MPSRFNRYLRKSFSSEFSKNVLTLVTGTSIAQLIPFIAAPILSRIYTPEDFGLLALYLTIAQVLGAIASGRYELAIVLPREETSAVRLVLLSLLISVGLSGLTFMGVLIGGGAISQLLGDDKLESWLYFLPVSVLMIGIFNALSYYHIRKKGFGDVAKANAYKSFGGTGIQLTFGLVDLWKSGGLILGQVGSHFVGNIRMVKNFLEHKEVIRKTSWADLKGLAIRYQDFPKFSSWGIFINTISQNVSNVFIAHFFTLTSVGFYSHAYKYLGLPLNLIGNSIAQVYMQKLSEGRGNVVESKRLYLGMAKKLFLIGLCIFIPAYFLIEPIYHWVFGGEWVIAGYYAKLMLPLFFARLMSNPMSYTLTIFEKQWRSLVVQIILLLVSVSCFMICFVLDLNIVGYIQVLSNSLTLTYLLLMFYYYQNIEDVS